MKEKRDLVIRREADRVRVPPETSVSLTMPIFSRMSGPDGYVELKGTAVFTGFWTGTELVLRGGWDRDW